jgi:organic radical activating enzyme
MTEPIWLDSIIELYITNECNLTCSDCNRYNNYNFTGNFDWRESEKAIMTWGQRIRAPLITIIGGEPALHPELIGWVDLAMRAWPGIPITIQTNGTVGHDQLQDIKAAWGTKVAVVVSMHDVRMQKYYSKKSYFLHAHQHDKKNKDKMFWLEDQTKFSKCALIDREYDFTVHDSDPDAAFQACAMKHSHTIFQGRLYKCPMVAILPQFAKQYAIDFSAQQKDLLSSYQGLADDCDTDSLIDFVNTRDKAIPQCRLCPSEFSTSTVTFDPKRKQRSKLNFDRT